MRKIVIASSDNPRPSSYPLISGDSFRDLADHIYDLSVEFDPTLIKRGDIIFVQSDIIDRYFQKIHKLIEVPYILITHNGDRNVSDKELLYLDDKIIYWFAQNVLVKHPKLTPIPIGIENAHYANAGYTPFYTKFMPEVTGRAHRILVAFNIATNVIDRRKAYEELSHNAKADFIKRRISQPEYVKTVKRYCFIASPPGNGEDCIQTWEAMLLGAIPIVERSVGIEYFKDINLPIHIINSWSDLSRLSEYELQEKYALIMSKADKKPLHMDYWINLINEKRKMFVNKK